MSSPCVGRVQGGTAADASAQTSCCAMKLAGPTSPTPYLRRRRQLEAGSGCTATRMDTS